MITTSKSLPRWALRDFWPAKHWPAASDLPFTHVQHQLIQQQKHPHEPKGEVFRTESHDSLHDSHEDERKLALNWPYIMYVNQNVIWALSELPNNLHSSEVHWCHASPLHRNWFGSTLILPARHGWLHECPLKSNELRAGSYTVGLVWVSWTWNIFNIYYVMFYILPNRTTYETWPDFVKHLDSWQSECSLIRVSCHWFYWKLKMMWKKLRSICKSMGFVIYGLLATNETLYVRKQIGDM